MPLHQFRFRHGQGIGLRKQLIDQANNLRFLRDQLQFEGFLFFAVHRYLFFPFRCKTGRCGAAQPTAGLRQLVHIIPNALCNGFPLQLRKHRGNIHHGTPHGRTGIKLLFDRHKRNFQSCQFFNQTGKIADITADSIQTVNDNCLKLPLPCRSHHFLEIRTVQVSTGKPLIFIDCQMVQGILPVVHPDVFLA